MKKNLFFLTLLLSVWSRAQLGGEYTGTVRIKNIPTGTPTDQIVTADTSGNIRKVPITSLPITGPQGPAGPQGPIGIPGPTGPQGPPGSSSDNEIMCLNVGLINNFYNSSGNTVKSLHTVNFQPGYGKWVLTGQSVYMDVTYSDGSATGNEHYSFPPAISLAPNYQPFSTTTVWIEGTFPNLISVSNTPPYTVTKVLRPQSLSQQGTVCFLRVE